MSVQPEKMKRVRYRYLRRMMIVSALIVLHIRYFIFRTSRLEKLRLQGLRRVWFPLPRLTPSEYNFANHWNLRISKLLMAAGAPYAKCMKRCLVIAHLMPVGSSLEMVIGIVPGENQEGHAWLEIDGKMVAEIFDPDNEPFREILRFPIIHHVNTTLS